MARYEFNEQCNGVEIYFESKPSKDVLSFVKANGWKWNGKAKCWYKAKSESSISFAKGLCVAPELFAYLVPLLKDAIEDVYSDGKKTFPEKRSSNKVKKTTLSKTTEKKTKRKESDRLKENERREETERLMAVARLKDALPSFKWKPEYENYSAKQCAEMLEKRRIEIEKYKHQQLKIAWEQRQAERRIYEESQKDFIKNMNGSLLVEESPGVKEIKTCLGNCSTCERTECLKYL